MSESSTRKTLAKRQQGQGLVEYALILVLVSVVVIVILSQLGPRIGDIFSNITGVLRGSVVANNSENDSPRFCVAHFGYYILFNDGVDEITVLQVPLYSDSDCTTLTAGITTTGPLLRVSAFTKTEAEERCTQLASGNPVTSIPLHVSGLLYHCTW